MDNMQWYAAIILVGMWGYKKLSDYVQILYRKRGKFHWAKLSRSFREAQQVIPMNLCSKYKHILVPGLLPRMYYRENPYTVDIAKV